MAFLTSSATCLLGFLICSSFLGAEAQKCIRGWLRNQGNCYAYFEEKLPWAEAEIECQAHGRGAHLASVLTKAESDLLARHIDNYPKDTGVWIGLRDVQKNGKWRWTDGSTYNYNAWDIGQPDNYLKSEYCGELRYSSNFEKWNDDSCEKRNHYVCKHDLYSRV